MANMFKVQLPMILSLPGFMITANYGLSSKDALEPLMVAISLFPYLLPSKVSIRIERALFHRTVFSYVTLTCSSHTFLQAGKVLRQILGSGLMHWQKDFQHLKDFRGATKVVEGGAAVVTAGASKVLANILTMQLIVELRELAITVVLYHFLMVAWSWGAAYCLSILHHACVFETGCC